MLELSSIDLQGKKGYPICISCHGRGLDVGHGDRAEVLSIEQRALGDLDLDGPRHLHGDPFRQQPVDFDVHHEAPRRRR